MVDDSLEIPRCNFSSYLTRNLVKVACSTLPTSMPQLEVPPLAIYIIYMEIRKIT
jgi:hypothetical protein